MRKRRRAEEEAGVWEEGDCRVPRQAAVTESNCQYQRVTDINAREQEVRFAKFRDRRHRIEKDVVRTDRQVIVLATPIAIATPIGIATPIAIAIAIAIATAIAIAIAIAIATPIATAIAIVIAIVIAIAIVLVWYAPIARCPLDTHTAHTHRTDTLKDLASKEYVTTSKKQEEVWRV